MLCRGLGSIHLPKPVSDRSVHRGQDRRSRRDPLIACAIPTAVLETSSASSIAGKGLAEVRKPILKPRKELRPVDPQVLIGESIIEAYRYSETSSWAAGAAGADCSSTDGPQPTVAALDRSSMVLPRRS